MNKAEWRAVGLVAAVYVYFLIFAEFAFIELARPVVGDGAGLRAVMGALGAGGVAGAALAAWRFDRARWARGLAGWLAGCGLAAGAAVAAGRGGPGALAAAGGVVGVVLGGATVWLACGLRAAAGGRRLGLVAGAGTGAAYAICNVPWVFEASPAAQASMAALAAAAGAALAWGMGAEATDRTDGETTGKGAGRWVVIFLALVWMDSAAFYIIQHTGELKEATWSGAWVLWGNAATHLGTAVLAGWWLDRGRAGWVAGGAAVALAGACHWITDTGAQVGYVAGVSLYSTALVFVPARLGRPAVVATIFAVAGWGGSALGIGMAQDLHGVPDWFAAAALVAVAAGLAWRGKAAPAVVAAGLAWAGTAGESRAEATDAEVAAAIGRGREIYVAEGCIHCHSQYVRPRTEDVVRWGPARPLEAMLAEKPPLPGNRRQGPDLANVGNRRTPEWNRLHLIAPAEVSPGTRMPSYAHLFAAGDGRGDDLVAYLASLGAGTEEARAATVAAWRPAVGAAVDAGRGAVWFARLCVQCHGAQGRGDGVVAGKLAGRVADLTRAGMDRDEERLARLIKFGRPGTAMAGHEALTDYALVSLARYVAGLQVGENAR
jgi:cytochrome c oxidase cbb3-type subunit 2